MFTLPHFHMKQKASSCIHSVAHSKVSPLHLPPDLYMRDALPSSWCQCSYHCFSEAHLETGSALESKL